MARYGWKRDTLEQDEKLIIQYFPLRNGQRGGQFIRLYRADGSELIADPHAVGIKPGENRRIDRKADGADSHERRELRTLRCAHARVPLGAIQPLLEMMTRSVDIERRDLPMAAPG